MTTKPFPAGQIVVLVTTKTAGVSKTQAEVIKIVPIVICKPKSLTIGQPHGWELGHFSLIF
jgi:hypothetical protein